MKALMVSSSHNHPHNNKKCSTRGGTTAALIRMFVFAAAAAAAASSPCTATAALLLSTPTTTTTQFFRRQRRVASPSSSCRHHVRSSSQASILHPLGMSTTSSDHSSTRDASSSSSSSNALGTRWTDSGRWESTEESSGDQGRFLMPEQFGRYFKVPNPASLFTKIICTIGPSTSDPTTIGRMMDAGMSAARINMSHGSHEFHSQVIDNVRKVAKARRQLCPIILDTKGPEIRISWLPKPSIELERGDKFVLLTGDHSSEGTTTTTKKKKSHDALQASVTYPYLSHAVHKGDVILLDDGHISLFVTNIPSEHEVHTQVIEGGKLVPNKGVNLPGCHVELPHITDKDEHDIRFGVSKHVEYIAHSFTRSASGINQVRELPGVIESGAHVIAKIESQEGLDNFASILRVSDGIMVARGDLGVEIPLERVCSVQKRLVSSCNASGKPVIVATELLDSMISKPRPTRAEASDVANAVFDGADCVMLSGETAVGKYPIEAIQTMSRICKEAELDVTSSLRASAAHESMGVVGWGGTNGNGGGNANHGGGGMWSNDAGFRVRHVTNGVLPNVGGGSAESRALRDAFAKSAVLAAKETGAELIIALTRTGLTAHVLAKFFSPVHVMVLSSSPQVCAQVLLHRSVTPYLVDSLEIESCVPRAISKAIELDLVRTGSRVLLLTGDNGLTANRLETFVVGEGMLSLSSSSSSRKVFSTEDSHGDSVAP